MTLFEYYIQYMTQICEGTLPAPAGITLTETDEMRRAMELQQQISAMGIPVFVRACAAAAGDEIPQDAYDSFSMEDMLSAAQTLAEHIRAYGCTAEAADSIEAGVARAQELGGEGPVCALGTLYFSGDVRQAFASLNA